MKKLLTCAALLALSATGVDARLTLADRMLLNGASRGQATLSSPMRSAALRGATTTAMVVLNDGYTIEDLEAEGLTVATVRGNIAVVSMPTADVERIAALPGIRQFELSRPRNLLMDRARPASGVSRIHAGEDLDQPYTGAGVVTGIVDGGIDPNHINFRDADGNSRVKYLAHIYIDYSSPDFWTGIEYDAEHINLFTTDTEATFHGTHTMGIMAGGYRGEVEAAVIQNSQIAPVDVVDNPYYGVAYESDIAVSCGDTYDDLIAIGMDRILDYAYYAKEPCVINLSLGSNYGSHSGKSVMAQFLDKAAEEAIIVVCAGNEGDIPLSLVKTLSEDDLEAKTFILPTYADNIRYGQVRIYSDKPFALQGVIFNQSRGRISYRMPVLDGQGQAEPQYYCSSDYVEYSNDITDAAFSNAFSGYCGVGWDYDENTEEYMGLMDFYTLNNSTLNATGNYILGFVVTGEQGQRIECYGDGMFGVLDDYDIEGWDDGSTDCTISDMACANDILTVGSYNTGDTWGGLDGKTYNYSGMFTAGAVSPFSSYGVLKDGRSLPHVCAPGAVINSSCSQYYVNNPDNGVTDADLSAVLYEGDRINYWCPAMGTSMSAPYVAGSIALWLQANPTLTIDDVKEIIAATSVRDADVLAGNPVQWGAGKFDAYAGLKEAIRRGSVAGPVADGNNSLMIKTVDHNTFELFLGGANALDVKVFNLQGGVVASVAEQGDQAVVDLSSLASGIYVVNVNGAHSRRIIVK